MYWRLTVLLVHLMSAKNCSMIWSIIKYIRLFCHHNSAIMNYMIEFSYANEYKSIFCARLHDHYLILNTCIREGVIVLFCLLTKLTFRNDKWNLQGQVKSIFF